MPFHLFSKIEFGVLTMSEKSQWGSKLGFILASAGSAIGLGAVWKFPYMTAANGGGGFLLVFLISTLLIGFPLLLAEFALGRSAGVSAIKTFGNWVITRTTTLSVGLVPLPFSSSYPLQCYWGMGFSVSRYRYC